MIVGASVHAGHDEKAVRKWLHEHAAALDRMPTAFFSVCLTAADDTDEARADARRYIDETLAEAGWEPRLVARASRARSSTGSTTSSPAC